MVMTDLSASVSDTARNSSWRTRHPSAFLALLGLIGLIAAFAAVWLLVAVIDLGADKTRVTLMDDALTNWFTFHGNSTLDAVFRAITALGGWLLFAVVVCAVGGLLARREQRRA